MREVHAAKSFELCFNRNWLSKYLFSTVLPLLLSATVQITFHVRDAIASLWQWQQLLTWNINIGKGYHIIYLQYKHLFYILFNVFIHALVSLACDAVGVLLFDFLS